MKAGLIFIFLMTCSFNVLAESTIMIKGDCYEIVIEIDDEKSSNLLTICFKENTFVERMYYANAGRLPAVCYGAGSVNEIDPNTKALSML